MQCPLNLSWNYMCVPHECASRCPRKCHCLRWESWKNTKQKWKTFSLWFFKSVSILVRDVIASLLIHVVVLNAKHDIWAFQLCIASRCDRMMNDNIFNWKRLVGYTICRATAPFLSTDYIRTICVTSWWVWNKNIERENETKNAAWISIKCTSSKSSLSNLHLIDLGKSSRIIVLQTLESLSFSTPKGLKKLVQPKDEKSKQLKVLRALLFLDVVRVSIWTAVGITSYVAF